MYPIPNFTQASSLFIYFSRPPLASDGSTGEFLTSDTTREPGFAALFHDLVPLWTAYDYVLAKGKQNANLIFAEIIRKENEIAEFYGLRNRDFRSRLVVSSDSNK